MSVPFRKKTDQTTQEQINLRSKKSKNIWTVFLKIPDFYALEAVRSKTKINQIKSHWIGRKE